MVETDTAMPEREETGITVKILCAFKDHHHRNSFSEILPLMLRSSGAPYFYQVEKHQVNPLRPAFLHGGVLEVGGEADQASVFRKVGG